MKMLLQEFWNGRFWPYCTANLRESTCVGYESAWRLHVAPRFGAMQMESISVELVDQLPAKPHYEPVILGIRQQRSLLQGFYDHPLEAWLICAVSCGLRTEEGVRFGVE